MSHDPADDLDGPHVEDPALDRVIALGDLDEVLREVDRRADAGDWDGLARLRRQARAATERGHQLWPASSWAEYRTALDGPAAAAGALVVEGTGYLAPGPLTEVVAQRHRWVDLADHVPEGPLRAVLAAERVLRGDDVPDDEVHELPGRLQPWEPAYPLVEYRVDGPLVAEPDVPVPEAPAPDGRVCDEEPDAADGARALVGALDHWAVHGDGRVRAVGVEGSAADALTTLGADGAAWTAVDLPTACSLLAWAAASGGGRGRRRGAAAGRLEVWWVLAALTGEDDDWPVDPGPAGTALRWWVWDVPGPPGGWRCRLAVEDPADGLAWALDAWEPPPGDAPA